MRNCSFPNDWDERALIDLAHYHNGCAFKPEDWSNDGTRIIRIEQLNNPEGRYDHFQGCFPEANAIDDGDLIFSWSATLKVAIWRHGRGVLNQHLFKVVPKAGYDRRFIFYVLDFNMEALGGGSHGSTMKHIKRGELERYSVRVPPLVQQQRIAEVLTTVDEAIEQTEALIAKMQQVKAGLMHDLFTRGVTPDGKLRPPREEAPDLYKESPLGWIPKEWACVALEALLAKTACPMRSGPFGSALLKDELVENGVPLLGIDNVFAERFVAEYRRFVNRHKFVELSRYSVFPGDVIITIMGTVGRCCIAPDDLGDALSSKHLWTMTFDQRGILPDLVCWQLNHEHWVKSWFARQAQGAVMDAIQSSTLRTLRLPVPPMDEQLLLRGRYGAGELRVATEREKLAKLLLAKRGLMHDLLTGRVRVPVAASQ